MRRIALRTRRKHPAPGCVPFSRRDPPEPDPGRTESLPLNPFLAPNSERWKAALGLRASLTPGCERLSALPPQTPQVPYRRLDRCDGRAKGFESVRGAVAHAMMCKNGPIYASRDARRPARCCTDPRDFYRKLSQKSGAGSQVSWQKDRVTFRTSVWRRFHRGRHLSDPAALAHALGSHQDSGRCFRSP
jgi:hypothetical protein